jgi:hypothetical protein
MASATRLPDRVCARARAYLAGVCGEVELEAAGASAISGCPPRRPGLLTAAALATVTVTVTVTVTCGSHRTLLSSMVINETG